MGAWGVGSFENDAARDWAYDLEAAADLSPVEEALDKVLQGDSGYLDADDAEEALAAVEVIAGLQGNPSEEPEPVDEWVSAHKQEVPARLAKKSHAAIARILGDDSELVELWRDSGSFDEWQAAVSDLRSRIRA